MRAPLWIPAIAAFVTVTAAPAWAGTGPRADLGAGHLGIGVDPGAFSLDMGLTNRLTLGVDARPGYDGTAWGGYGARATMRLFGHQDGWNLSVGGRVSVPNASLLDSTVRDVGTAVGNQGAVSGYLLLSMPLTNWFILRYPIGMTYYVGPGQNGGQAWTFGGANWSPNDGHTFGLTTPGTSVYLPALQLLPEAAFKFWGFEATLFGTSIAGFRMAF
jgi:hypothetical protein